MAPTRDPSEGKQSLSSALNEAQAIVEAARQRAEELQLQADESYKSAYEVGYSDGFTQGRYDCAATALRLLEDSLLLEERLSDAAARLALSICSFVLGDYLKIAPDAVKPIALRALQESANPNGATVLVNPADLPSMESALDDLRQATRNANITITADESISRGGCIIRTLFGDVDATLETILQSIAARLGLSND